LNTAQATPRPADVPQIWGILWLAGVVLLGLVLFFAGLASRPPERSALTTIDRVGPIGHTMPLITVSGGRHGNSTYRTQKIPLPIPGSGIVEVSPPPTLWVDGIDGLRPGQRVRFLVDPPTRTVFEVTSEGRTMLAYADSLANRQRRSTGLIVAGLFCLGVSALHGFSLRKAA